MCGTSGSTPQRITESNVLGEAMQEENELLGYTHACSGNMDTDIVTENELVVDSFNRGVLNAFVCNSLPPLVL